MNVVLVGPHGSGKSTLGRLLATRLGVPFDREIGEMLAAMPEHRPACTTAEDAQWEFDRLVMKRELDRDMERSDCRLRIVETWHPGNLAYAQLRSPGVVEEFLPEIRESVRRAESVVLPLWAHKETLSRRKHEPGPLPFFIEVGRNAHTWAVRLGIPVVPLIRTDTSRIEVTLERVIERLKPFLRSFSIPGADSHSIRSGNSRNNRGEASLRVEHKRKVGS